MVSPRPLDAAGRRLTWAALVLAALAGCQKTDGGATAVSGAASAPAESNEREIWEALFLEGSKIGYSRTTIRPVERSGEKLIEIDIFNHLRLVRFGQPIQQELKMSMLETRDGRVVQFTTEADFGPTPVRMTGRVEGDQMVIRTPGAPQPIRIPWSREILGFRGLEKSLEDRPMAPGERRSLRVLAPLLNQVAEVELTAGKYEDTTVLGKPAKLLRIDTTSRLPDGQVIDESIWTDEAGQTIRRRATTLRQESYRTSRETAMAQPSGPADFDLGTDTIVKVERPIADPHKARRIRYRVELDGTDPLKVFSKGPTQSMRSLGPHAAELTVERFDPLRARPAGAAGGNVVPEYSSANSLLQTDNPRIRAMALEAKGEAASPRDVALALERYVNRIVETKDFSQTFASAADVAESRQGDCTEHAVLLAALARACGIPSRVAIGLVYVPRATGFGYHMWTEVHVDGQWMPLDATLGQGGIGAGHIKLTDSSLDGASAYSTFLPVAQVVGQLRISVLETE